MDFQKLSVWLHIGCILLQQHSLGLDQDLKIQIGIRMYSLDKNQALEQ